MSQGHSYTKLLEHGKHTELAASDPLIIIISIMFFNAFVFVSWHNTFFRDDDDVKPCEQDFWPPPRHRLIFFVLSIVCSSDQLIIWPKLGLHHHTLVCV